MEKSIWFTMAAVCGCDLMGCLSPERLFLRMHFFALLSLCQAQLSLCRRNITDGDDSERLPPEQSPNGPVLGLSTKIQQCWVLQKSRFKRAYVRLKYLTDSSK